MFRSDCRRCEWWWIVSERQKLVIDRSKWLRGEGGALSVLHRAADGKMCCLGFYGQACGVTVEEMGDLTSPSRLANGNWPAWLVDKIEGNSNVCIELMSVNDRQGTDSAIRESHITEVFHNNGVDVTFVDSSPESV